MPAQVEEVVWKPTAGTPRRSRQRPASISSGGVRGRHDPPPRRPLRRGQGPAVHLAVAGQRQRREDDHVRRDHVGGQRAARKARRSSARGRRLRPRDGEGREPAVAGAVFADDHDALADAREAGQRRFDLPQLDAEAADLDLGIRPARELGVSVGR